MKILMASLHRIVLILTLIINWIWNRQSSPIEVHRHCSISNWQSFTLVKLFELLWVLILIFLSLLSDGRQGAELCFVTSGRFSIVIDSASPIFNLLLLKIFSVWVNEADFGFMI